MSNKINKFTEGSINHYLWTLALPALITIFAGLSFITVDTYFLARLGKEPLTAISFIFPVASLLQMIGVGLGIAASSVLSRLIGADKHEEVSINIVTLLLMAMVISIIAIPLMELGLNKMFHLMGADAAVMPYIRSFMHIWIPSIFLVFTSYIASNILRSHGKPKLSARMQISSSVINAVLSPTFIFLCHWGIAGSALAGVIARLIMVAVMYYYIIHNYVPHLRQTIIEALSSFGRHAKDLIAIAIPAVLTNAIGPISTFWMVHLLAHLHGGDNSVAGYGIASRIEMLAVVPLYALSASVGPIIGQNLGAKKYPRSFQTLMLSYRYCLLWGAITSIVLYAGGHLVATIFTQDPTIIRVAAMYLAFLPWSYASWGIIMMTNANFNSIGQPFKSTTITFIRLCVIFMPLSYVLGIKFGYMGVFAAFAISNIATSLGAAYYGINHWKKLNATITDMPATAVTGARN